MWHKFPIYGPERRKFSTLSCVAIEGKGGIEDDSNSEVGWRKSFEGKDDKLGFRPTEMELSEGYQ